MANEVQPLVGNDCGLYVNDSDYDTPVWTEIDEASDVSLAEWNVSEAEIVTRASDWAVALAAKFRCAVEFKYLWGANWFILNFLRAMYMNRGWSDIWFSDGDPLVQLTHTVQGLRMPVQVRQFPINQPNEDVVWVDTVRMTPTYVWDVANLQRIEPKWYTSPDTFKTYKELDPKLRSKTRLFEGNGKWIQEEAGELQAIGLKSKIGLPPKYPVIVPENWKEVYSSTEKKRKTVKS